MTATRALLTAAFISILFPASQACAGGLSVQASQTRNLFDGAGKPDMSLFNPPSPVEIVEAAPLAGVPQGGSFDILSKDAPCAVIDAQFFVQPTRAQGAAMLAGCLQGITKRTGVTVRAVSGPVRRPEGTVPGIVILVGPRVGPQSTVSEELTAALSARNGSLFGHPAQISVLK